MTTTTNHQAQRTAHQRDDGEGERQGEAEANDEASVAFGLALPVMVWVLARQGMKLWAMK